MSTVATHPLMLAIRTEREARNDSYQRCMESAARVIAAVRSLKPRILFFEDDLGAGKTYTRYLSLSAVVVWVKTAEEFLFHLATEEFSAIFTDTVLFLNGTKLLESVKVDQPDLPVVVLSGHGPDKEQREMIENKKIKAWYEKPLSAEELRSLVPLYAKGILE